MEASRASNQFERLAAYLAGSRMRGRDSELATILEKFEYLPLDGTEPSQTRSRVALLQAAARFSDVFQLASRDAPGVTFFGATISAAGIDSTFAHQARSSASGAGLSLRQAFESCIGEGVEYLSQFETSLDRLRQGPIEDGLAAFDPASRAVLSEFMRLSARDNVDWIEATQLSSGRSVPFPADLCLRRTADRSALTPPFSLSSGCAAGTSFETAALHGMLELVERDAASLWWRGGIRGRLVALEGPAMAAAAAWISRARRGVTTRRTWLLDITTDIDVPCIVAMSCHDDGRGFACGLAARLSVEAAIRSALTEMCQMELAYAVVERKRREGGEEALNEYDHRHIARSTLIDAASCELLHPVAPSRATGGFAPGTPTQQLAALVERLSARGIETFAIDLSRPMFGIAVVRIAAPALQMEPSDVATERLVSAQRQTGGADLYTRGISLL
ncbi:ribosomal protein S12 methylthiotransferase accessory factor [Bradyrhizobium sp. cir1]|uniref:YcaO-like family protein n=1 Tax=Bradyrhizobium sp. cir1 TaxID=1445730 RepID=UPI001606456F|nr:YcaO-like family protein [Bradyrhizobium sp. cir1]MBB4373298.1 ribosomal protein S12 methylthiotransferase accessory factor [Bradyrhizobium sp. cir1]